MTISTVVSTFRTGMHLRLCTRCLLFVDANGKPDPTQYTPEWIAAFEARTEEKCTHQIESKK